MTPCALCVLQQEVEESVQASVGPTAGVATEHKANVSWFHAVARAICGGPVYVSDRVGEVRRHGSWVDRMMEQEPDDVGVKPAVLREEDRGRFWITREKTSASYSAVDSGYTGKREESGISRPCMRADSSNSTRRACLSCLAPSGSTTSSSWRSWCSATARF